MFQNVGEQQFKKRSKWVVLFLFVVTFIFVSLYPRLRIDYDFEKFFPINDEETNFFLDYRNKFEPDNDFVLIALENKKGIFETEFLKKIERFQFDINKIKEVQYSSSLLTEKDIVMYPGGFVFEQPYIDFTASSMDQNHKRVLKNREIRSLFLSKNEDATCLFVRHTDFLSGEKMKKFVHDINDLVVKYDFDGAHVAGRTVGQLFYIERMSRELLLFVSLSLVLVIVFLLISFRSGWGLFLHLILIIVSMLWIVGFIAAYGEPVSVVMTTLPSIMFVVAMSDVIHLLSRYLDAVRAGDGNFPSIKVAIREVGMPTFLTSLTTAIGFFGLYFVSVQPLQVFGIVTGIGVMIAFFLTIMLLPILLYYWPGPKHVKGGSSDPFWKKRLGSWFLFTLKNGQKILIASILLAGVSIFFSTKIEMNSYLVDELKPDEPMKMDFNFLDENFGGVRPFEIAVILKDTTDNLWSAENLRTIETVEQFAEKKYGAVIKMSPIVALKVIHRSMHSGKPDQYKLPSSQRETQKMRKLLRRAKAGKVYKLIVDSTDRIARISGTIPDLGSKLASEKNADFKVFISNKIDTNHLEFKLTGTAHLLEKNISYLSVSLIKGLTFSILLVALIMGFVFRSFWMVGLSMIPNLLPLLCIAGIMGIFDIQLKTSVAIIFTIAFGIAVDDTIHFLGKFKMELNKGKGKLYALKRTYLTTGKAMILTTLILCSGFLLLVISSFQGTFLMGVLLCFTLFFALIADLTLLPVLLLLFYNPQHKKLKN